MLTDPIHVGLASNYFNLGIGFVQEGCRFQCALSCANDRDPLTRELSHVPPLVTVTHLLRRKTVENCGLFPKWTDSGGNHYTGRPDLFTVLEGKLEVSFVLVNAQNHSLIQV
jgi:hypothetical protein